MSKLAWLAENLSERRVARQTAAYLGSLAQEPVRASRRSVSELLRTLRNEPGPKVTPCETMWGEPVVVPIMELVKACGVATGGMGSGKTMAAGLILDKIIERLPELRSVGFGVLDAKGELFDRALFLLARRLERLEGEAREELLRRIVIIDFSSREAVSSYNILSRWPYTERDFFVTSRLETLGVLLPAGEKLALRGATRLKNGLALLSEFGLPLTYLDSVLSSDTLRAKLLRASENPTARFYFERYFVQDGKQTIAAPAWNPC